MLNVAFLTKKQQRKTKKEEENLLAMYESHLCLITNQNMHAMMSFRVVNGLPDVPSFGMVKDGTKCSSGGICVNAECISLSRIMPMKCPVGLNGLTCSGHGVRPICIMALFICPLIVHCVLRQSCLYCLQEF